MMVECATVSQRVPLFTMPNLTEHIGIHSSHYITLVVTKFIHVPLSPPHGNIWIYEAPGGGTNMVATQVCTKQGSCSFV